jgi:hypothetical protein
LRVEFDGFEQAPGDLGNGFLGNGFPLPCGPPGLLTGEQGVVAI